MTTPVILSEASEFVARAARNINFSREPKDLRFRSIVIRREDTSLLSPARSRHLLLSTPPAQPPILLRRRTLRAAPRLAARRAHTARRPLPRSEKLLQQSRQMQIRIHPLVPRSRTREKPRPSGRGTKAPKTTGLSGPGRSFRLYADFRFFPASRALSIACRSREFARVWYPRP